MKNKIIIGVFLVMLAVFITMLALPADKESFEAENRTMSTMPPLTEESFVSGEFAPSFTSFVGDNIFARSFFLDFSKRIDSAKGMVPETGSVVSTMKDIGTGTSIKLTLLSLDDTVMEMFMKKPETEKAYTDAVNHYAKKLPDDIELYSMLIPTQLEFKDPMYKNLQDSQTEAIEEMYGMLDESVTTVDVCSALEKHSGDYIYLRTDHHWTPLGAYYAYREFMKTEGGSAVNKNDFDKNEIHNFFGYLCDRVDNAELLKAPDTIEWYDTDPEEHIKIVMHRADESGALTDYSGLMFDRKKANYSFFFGSDHPIVEMTNDDMPDGKTIAVIKDSYANAFAPWLIKSYHKVLLVDPRIYKGDFKTVIDTFKPDEVMIMNYIFTTNFPDYCKMLTDMYK